jgi:hypothetical protein
MVGRRSPQTPSINRLTSLPDSVLSKRRRSRHAKFQHIRRRHHAKKTELFHSEMRKGGRGSPPHPRWGRRGVSILTPAPPRHSQESQKMGPINIHRNGTQNPQENPTNSSDTIRRKIMANGGQGIGGPRDLTGTPQNLASQVPVLWGLKQRGHP